MANAQPAEITEGTPSDTSLIHSSEDGTVDNSRSHNERDISRLQGAAHTYSDSKTYAVRDLVTYSQILYRNRTAVTVAETFDPAKWDAIGPVQLKRQFTLSHSYGTNIHRVGLGSGAFSSTGTFSAFMDGDGYGVNITASSTAQGAIGGYKQVASLRRDLNPDITFKFQIDSSGTEGSTNLYMGLFASDPVYNSNPGSISHVAFTKRIALDDNFYLSASNGTSNVLHGLSTSNTDIHTVRIYVENNQFHFVYDGSTFNTPSQEPGPTDLLNLYAWVEQGSGTASTVKMNFWFVEGFADP